MYLPSISKHMSEFENFCQYSPLSCWCRTLRLYQISQFFINVLRFPVFQDITKRLSLPADMRLPESFLLKLANNSGSGEMMSPSLNHPLSRQARRSSLVSRPHKLERCDILLIPNFYHCILIRLVAIRLGLPFVDW